MSKKKRIRGVDYKQCQAEILSGSFMTFGPRQYERCKNKAEFIATEKRIPGPGMKKGSMSLCSHCKDMLLKIKGIKYASIMKITAEPTGTVNVKIDK